MTEALTPEAAPSSYDELAQQAAINYCQALSEQNELESLHWRAAFLTIARHSFDSFSDTKPTDLEALQRYINSQYSQVTGSDFWEQPLSSQTFRMEIREALKRFEKTTSRKLTREGIARGILNDRTGLMAYRLAVNSSINRRRGGVNKPELSDTEPDQN